MTQDFAQTHAYITALHGDAETAVVDWRAIHDTRKDVPAIPFRGTLRECWSSIVHYNAQGYGIFAVVACMDGQGRELANVLFLRAHYVDLDNLSAQQNYERAAASHPAPWFAVQTSPGKYHVFWPVAAYSGNDRFQLVQRKLRQVFDGDRAVIDAARVMRVPGTLHMKKPEQPHLVTCWALPGYGQPIAVDALESALASVNVIDGGQNERRPLGDPALAAPSLEWVKRALELTDPNDLDRGEWIAFTSAVKQAAWSHADPDTIFKLWSDWCERYTTGEGNNVGENLKQWNSIRDTELGWHSLLNRVPSLKGLMFLDGKDKSAQIPGNAPAAPQAPGAPPVPSTPPVPEPAPLDCSGPYLTHLEQQEWFRGVTFVINLGMMLTPSGRFLNVTQFNAAYGGKNFIIDDQGKKTNEAWAAATRSTLWNVPRVDHVRFVPSQPHGALIPDDLGRDGVNLYQPINAVRKVGDASPFLRHVAALFPDPNDQKILLDYLAHNVKYPGHKIPWAPVLQSAEGVGKGVFKLIMSHAMGRPYTYFPNAKELSSSGSQFNAWMRYKLFIIADEIKVDDRRDLIEVLKPMISEERIEVQGKGKDQDLEDNFSNWLFFTNYKDAIPVDKNGRRYAIFYSPFQKAEELLAAGMGDAYFKMLYDWLKSDGAAIVTDYLMAYPIQRGAIPMRAPDTSSTAEAIKLSRSPIERVVTEAVADGIAGFRGGWVSALAVVKRIKELGALTRAPSPVAVATALEKLGYEPCGRASRPYFQEDKEVRPELYFYGRREDTAGYGKAQGWE